MFEFKKICDGFEKLTPTERGLILTEKSIVILAKLRYIDFPDINPAHALAGFIIGSAVADGKINEKEYLLIYPALLSVFGNDFDYSEIKESFRLCSDVKKAISEYTEEMLAVLDFADETLKEDVITLCLCIVAIDGKVSLKEKRYIKRLLRA